VLHTVINCTLSYCYVLTVLTHCRAVFGYDKSSYDLKVIETGGECLLSEY